MKKLLLTIVSAGFALSLNAEIWTPRIISDNMMLQRKEPVKLWGKAAAGANVEVKFGAAKAAAKADKDGKWSLSLPAMEADKNGKTIEFYENGKLSKEVKNVLVGEVWVSGGQSNMQWVIQKTTTYDKARPRAEKPSIRFFTRNDSKSGAEPAEDTLKTSGWIVISPKTLVSISAVAYYFAEKLNDDLDVPVGIIQTAMPGSKMSCWLQREDMREGFNADLAAYDAAKAKYNYAQACTRYERAMKKYNEEVENAKAEGKKYAGRKPAEPEEHTPWGIHNMPCGLYNCRLAPIRNFTVKGVIWYQGEADSGQPDTFAAKFVNLVDAWRKYFGKADMPFYFAQLSSFEGKYDWKWGPTRWAQVQAQKQMKNTAMVMTLDIGVEKDVHPQNKIVVGNRFAEIAMNELYGKKNVAPYAPVFESAKYNGAQCVVKFDTFGGKLKAKGEAKGIEVLIKDKWVAANDAKLDGETLAIKSPTGEPIEGVRYLFNNWCLPEIFLYNQNDVPASGFIDTK